MATCLQAEEDAVVENVTRKRGRTDDGSCPEGSKKARPDAEGVEPKAKAKAASSKPKEKAASKRKNSPKGKAAPKEAPKSKAKSTRSKASKKAVETPPTPEANDGDDLEVHPEPADAKKLAAKEKRRQRAADAFNLLKKEQRAHKDMLGDLGMPASMGERISFTVTDPEKNGAAIRVILAAESFYVTTVQLDHSTWPSACGNLKVQPACVFKTSFILLVWPVHMWQVQYVLSNRCCQADQSKGLTIPWHPQSPANAWVNAKMVAGWYGNNCP